MGFTRRCGGIVVLAMLVLSCADNDSGTDSNGNDDQGTSGLMYLTSFSIPGAAGLALNSSYAYVSGSSGFYVIDISSPGSPQELGFFAEPKIAVDLVASEENVFAAVVRNGIKVVRVANPQHPGVIGQFRQGSGRCLNLALVDTVLYVANADDGVWVLDVGDEVSPRLEYTLTTSARDVAAAGRYLWILDGTFTPGDWLRKFVLGELLRPHPACSTLPFVGSIGGPNALTAADEFVLVASAAPAGSSDQGLRTFSSATCELRGNVPTYGFSRDVCISGSIAYVVDYGSGLYAIDMSDPINPAVLDSSDVVLNPQKVAVNGEYIYVTNQATSGRTGQDGLYIFRYRRFTK